MITTNSLGDNRPSWDEYYIGVARAVAARGDCTRSQVGAVVVGWNHFAAFGYNGTQHPGTKGCLEGACPRGLLDYDTLPSTPDYSNCIAVHAEANAIKHSGAWIMGSTMYITREPCEDCVTLMTNERVSRVVWVTPTGIIKERRLE